jgi:hypothetical protein
MSTHQLVLPFPAHVGGVSLFLDVSGQSAEVRQHVVSCTAFLDTVALTLDTPNWFFSERLGAPFCYLPTDETDGLLALPPLHIGREITRLRFDLTPWARQAPVLTVHSMWAKAVEPSGESTVFALSTEEDIHA